jgi:predicted secreted protein
MERQPPAAQESTEPAVVAAEEATAAEVQEAPAEAGLVDIASILGAPTVTVVRSRL